MSVVQRSIKLIQIKYLYVAQQYTKYIINSTIDYINGQFCRLCRAGPKSYSLNKLSQSGPQVISYTAT